MGVNWPPLNSICWVYVLYYISVDIYIHTGLKTLIWYNWIFIQKSLVTQNTLQALYAMCDIFRVVF